ncbi:MAG TPA: threonine--tRNA ligase [Solirubrobacteraceae bacterium]|jgi:threonyl-tRNA synthetase|nr:threonine--tRNA ligase [Solirubrobacteraceae bacterium]
MSLKVTLPDGNSLELSDGATGADAAAAIGPGLARAALAIEVRLGAGQGHDGATGEGTEVRDLARPLPDGAHIAILTKNDGPKALELIRHDAAHVLAAAVTELYPGVKISIGPPIEDGFYYDFEFPEGAAVSEADFPRIEERMRAHVKAAEPFEREDVPVGHARERFLAERQDYKVELIDDLVTAAEQSLHREPLTTVSLYTNGPFTDLCRGPHAPSTKTIGAFKLSSLAGAYWRGDSTRTMLTRIYGTAFFNRAELEEYLERIEQAKARDHRKLGRELGLFAFSEVSPGAAFWMPAGTTIFNSLVGLSRQMGAERGYSEVKTPQIFDAELWRTSGHWDKYRENMFTLEAEDREMAVKPMNCPGHCHLFSQTRHSYRDLPVRYFEPGLLHRNEASGVLHGLLRVRHFAQDDGHIFCTEEQVQGEVTSALEMAFATYALFDFDVRLELSTRPEQRVGTDEMWDRAEQKLTRALDELGLAYELNPGDGAFYGPKIDMHMTDSLGRSWQLGTVQLDYSMPARFGLTYSGADNHEHTPVMIHRAMLGSYERFIGIMLEHYAGVLPLWLAPVQAIVLPVADRFNEHAAKVRDALAGEGARVELDHRSESIKRKIRDAELRKVPYMLVIGEREQQDGTVSLREHGRGDAGSVPLEEFTTRLAGELYSAALTPRKSSHSHA